MTKSLAIKLATAVIALAACASALGQPGGGATAGVPPASAAMSAKANRAADRQLAKAVRQALSRTKGLSTVNVSTTVKRGVVTLRGSVPDSRQVDLAGRVASGVAGVRSVNNELE
ncbi:BON domain-containing protein [Burkholderia multivorans]|uniref:BON domain-containing protein n=2 Tax=Burkholderia multivorans TaxID=87883 RepID=UPI0019D2EAFE|nr:BON domain-containing protein [Burkholderia multivorans]MBN6738820.1 BON domain-containing protein [Burkholderia multivorans]MBN7130093.1 BON domain-containing protein [Burkholderia multivorans]MBN8173450.1 BON domain-containing protein [Burkholderia multivorans]QSL29425.1 BON domain-containing protein [Burkholderia multivorans]